MIYSLPEIYKRTAFWDDFFKEYWCVVREVSQEIVLSSRMLIVHFEKAKTVTSSTVGTTCVGGLKLNNWKKNRIVVDKVENISVN